MRRVLPGLQRPADGLRGEIPDRGAAHWVFVGCFGKGEGLRGADGAEYREQRVEGAHAEDEVRLVGHHPTVSPARGQERGAEEQGVKYGICDWGPMEEARASLSREGKFLVVEVREG